MVSLIPAITSMGRGVKQILDSIRIMNVSLVYLVYILILVHIPGIPGTHLDFGRACGHFIVHVGIMTSNNPF